jgi:hypothetical protein
MSGDKTLKAYSVEVKHAALDAIARLLAEGAPTARDAGVSYAAWDQVCLSGCG